MHAPSRRLLDEPTLDVRVRRVNLGRTGLAPIRLMSYARKHPGVKLVSALDRYNILIAMLKRRLTAHAHAHVTLTQHEMPSGDCAFLKPMKARVLKTCVRRYFNNADAIVAVSQAVADDLCVGWKIERARVRVIHNPVFDPQFFTKARAAPVHPWLIEDDLPLVMAAGRLHPVKGFDDLIRAFAELRAWLPARLIILGEGGERANLESLIQELGLVGEVALPGRVEDLAPWLMRSDCFALPSRSEGFSNVLVSALSAGLPIVATRCPGASAEILGDGKWGQLVEPGHVSEMADALHRALTLRRIEPAELRHRAQTFSVERAVEGYLSLWNETVAAPN